MWLLWGFPEVFTSIRCSMALVFVESSAFHIDFAHQAIPAQPGLYLGIPRVFHFYSVLSGFSFCGECRISYRFCT